MKTPLQQDSFYVRSTQGASDLHTAQTFMHADKPLTPEMVSSLLHVDVLLDNPSTHTSSFHSRADRYTAVHDGYYTVGIVVASLLFTVLLGIILLKAPEFDSLHELI